MLKLTLLTLSSVAALVFGDVLKVSAAVLNSSFESGNFQSWSTAGQVTVEDANFGVTPQDGTYQAVLETLQDTTEVGGSDLENFLGLTVGSLTDLGVTEGSAIKQTVTLKAGDIISFSWNFLTDQDPSENSYNDLGFFVLNGFTPLADTTEAANLSLFTRLSRETGYKTASITVQAAGIYLLGFGVVDVDKTDSGDTAVNSALLIDNISVTSVPEPLTLLGVATAALLGTVFKRNLS